MNLLEKAQKSKNHLVQTHIDFDAVKCQNRRNFQTGSQLQEQEDAGMTRMQRRNNRSAAAYASASAAGSFCANIAIILTGIAFAVSVLLSGLSLAVSLIAAVLLLGVLVFEPPEPSDRYRS